MPLINNSLPVINHMIMIISEGTPAHLQQLGQQRHGGCSGEDLLVQRRTGEAQQQCRQCRGNHQVPRQRQPVRRLQNIRDRALGSAVSPVCAAKLPSGTIDNDEIPRFKSRCLEGLRVVLERTMLADLRAMRPRCVRAVSAIAIALSCCVDEGSLALRPSSAYIRSSMIRTLSPLS